MEDNVSWLPHSNNCLCILKHLLNHICDTEALNRPQKPVSCLSAGLDAEPSTIPCLISELSCFIILYWWVCLMYSVILKTTALVSRTPKSVRTLQHVWSNGQWAISYTDWLLSLTRILSTKSYFLFQVSSIPTSPCTQMCIFKLGVISK